MKLKQNTVSVLF